MGNDSETLPGNELDNLKRNLEEMNVSDNKEKQASPADEQKKIEASIYENGSYVNIDDDYMGAWLYLAPPVNREYTMDEIMDFLRHSHITTGFHTSNLAAMIKKKIVDREILVAKGQPAIEGTDGYFEYKFDPEQYNAPRVLANGAVDYTNMSGLQNVHAGDVVAVYHHAKQGQNGYDIFGKPLNVRPVKEIPPLRGQSISNQDNPDIYLAIKDGKIEFKNGRIDIQTVHEIFGDVTLITGKVEFFGDILIHGNVEAGVVVRAGRNIEIQGIVEAVNLFSGGDIVLSRGIQGAQKAKISARGNIFADFIEHTVVNAGGNVQANIILNSRVSADGEVILTGKKGAIIGGYTHGFLGITATEIGNEAEVRTVVHAGCEKDLFYKNMDIRKKENDLKEQFTEVSTQLSELSYKKKLNNGILPSSVQVRFKKLEEEVKSLKKELTELIKERQELDQIIEKGRNAGVIVNGNIYRGTVVSLIQMQMPIEHSTCYLKFYGQRGMIESSVIAYS